MYYNGDYYTEMAIFNKETGSVVVSKRIPGNSSSTTIGKDWGASVQNFAYSMSGNNINVYYNYTVNNTSWTFFIVK